jgi:hypothetical protein
MRLIWIGRETKNFLTEDWTAQIALIRFNKTAFCINLPVTVHSSRLRRTWAANKIACAGETGASWRAR